MGRSRRGRKPKKSVRRSGTFAAAFVGHGTNRRLTIDPLESRVLLAADMNVRFEVDAPGPVSTLAVGENFTLKVFVQDARATPLGVLQAYYNLAYDTNVAAVTGPVVNGPDFQITASGDDSTAGIIKAAGGLSTTQVPPTPGSLEQLLFSVPMKIVGAGQFNLTPSLATSINPSDTVQLYDSSAEPLSAMNFKGLPLAVTSGPAVAFINTADSTPTNSTQVHYTVNFNEPVSGVNASDFTLVQTGITGSTIATISPTSGFNTSYTVTVNAGNLTASTGTLGLNLIDGDVINDGANNTLAGGHSNQTLFTGQTYTIDRTAPTVSSIAAAGANPTNTASVQYTVTFSESVTGVAAADFALAASGITGASISSVAGSGTTYTVTVNTGSGDGTLGLNLVDGSAKITDAAGNTLAGGSSGNTLVTGQTYTIRKTPPAVTAITPASASPTNAASVQYAVTFNESVSGLAASDFKLVSSGVTGASISSVTGSGTNWTVNVATGTGSGTLGLNLVDGAAKISDTAGNFIAGGNSGNVLFTGTPAYTIDKTPISVSSIALAQTSPTNRSSVDFTVTFNKSVSGVTQADFALVGTGTTGAAITGISGSGSTYTVTASTGTGNGTLGLNLVNGSATISDAAGNILAGGNTGSVISAGPTYTIDKTPVSVSSIVLAQTSPTNQSSVAFTVTFNKSVSGVAQADFALATAGITSAAISNVAGSGTTYTVTVSTGTGSGTLGLNFINGAATISDAAGNTLAGGNTGAVISSGPAYTIDKTPISVSSIALVQATSTNQASVSFTITFNKSITGLTQADFSLGASGLTGAAITNLAGSGSAYTVTASTGSGNGSLGLNFINGSAQISDAAGNTLAGGNTGAVISSGPAYTIDKTPLSVSSIVLAQASPTNATSVSYTVTFNKNVSGVAQADFALVGTGTSGAAITGITGSGSTYTVTASTGTGNGTLGLNLIDGSAKISDAAGNSLAGGGTTAVISTGPAYTIDKTPLSVSSITLVQSASTNRATVDFTVTFNKSVTGVAQADFALAPNGVSGAAITNLTGSGATYTLTASTGSGNGTLGLNLVDGAAVIKDAAGNVLAGGGGGSILFTGPTYTIDKTPLTVSSITLVQSSTTNLATVAYSVTFNKSVSGVTSADFGLGTSGVTGASITSVTGSGASYTVNVNTGTGNGSLNLNLINGPATITDTAGNTLAGGGTGTVLQSGPTYTIDKTPLAVSSIALAGASPTNRGSVGFTVTFNKSVSGVTSADFALAASGVTGAAITNVAGSGTTYTVTAGTGTGNGSLGLNAIDGAAQISDAAGNTLAGGNTKAILSTGPTYTIDKTPVSVSSMTLVESSPTKLATVDFTVTFNTSVTGLTPADFALDASGLTGASITNLTGSGTAYTVTASTGTGSGTLGLKLIDGPAQISDVAGNTLAGGNSGATLFTSATPYTIDKTPPSASAIALADASPTRAASVDFTVTFSEPVSGLATSDFATSGSGITGASVTSVSGSGATWTVTVNTGTGDGTLGLNLIDGPAAISDAAGNTLAGGGTSSVLFSGQTQYTVLKSPPAVSSIALAGSGTTNASAVSFTVTFDRAVTGVVSSDFSPVAGGGVAGAAVSSVTGSGTTWTATVNTGTGDGTLGLNLIDGESPISDAAGNTLAGGNTLAVIFAGTASYTIDKTPPDVTSIATSDVTPTAAATVHFTVTFSESVTGVAAGDFNLAQSGVSGAAITDVSGSGTTWTVTAATGTGNGTLGLNLVDGPASIVDAAGNTLGGGDSGSILFTGDTYTIDRTLPTVVSVAPAGSSPTNQASVAFTVTFSESVTGVDDTDFAPVASGLTGAQVSGVSGSGSTYTVTVSTGSGSGTLGLNVVDGHAITDSTSKVLAGGNTGKLIFAGTPPYTIDKTPVSVSSIAPAGSSPTNVASVDFTVTFNKSVSGVDASDFDLVQNGISGASITGVSGSGTTWTITANTGTGSGTLGLNLIDGASPISDDAGNTLAGGDTKAIVFQGTAAYTIDKSAILVNSIALAEATPTNLASVDFTVTFNKSVTGVVAADFALVPSGMTGAAITNVTGSGTTWTVTAGTGTGNGTLSLNLIDGTAAITDAAGNTLAGGGSNGVLFQGTSPYTIDKTPVSVSSIVAASANPTNQASVDFTVTFNKPVSGLTLADFALDATALSGATLTNLTGSGTTYTVTANTGSGSGTLGLSLIDGPAKIVDAAGNSLAGGGSGSTIFVEPAPLYTIDKTAIAVSTIALADSSPTNQSSVDFTVTFNKSVTGVTAADFKLSATGITGEAITGITGSGTTWTVTASTGAGNGTLGLNFIDGSATLTDAAGNTAAGGNSGDVLFAGPSSYTIDKTPVAVNSIALTDSSPTNRTSVSFTVVFNKSVSGVTAADFDLDVNGLSGASITGVTGSGTTYTVTASTGNGNGTIGLNFIDGSATISDAAGNTLAGSASGAVLFAGTTAYTIDKTPISVTSIVPVESTTTNLSSVGFTITFDKSVTGLTSSDFALATSGITGAAITNISGSGATYTVTVSTGAGNGTLGLNVIDGPSSISDAAGNMLAGGNTGNVIFSGTPSYTIDKTPLSVTVTLGTNPTHATSVDFTVVFNKSVSGVTANDFALAATGLTGASITNVNGSGTTYTVTASSGSGNGTLALNLVDGPSKIADAAGNSLAGADTAAVIFAGPGYTIDKTPVSVSSIALVQPGTTNQASVEFTVTFNKSVSGLTAADFSLDGTGITGAAITNVTGSGATWTVTASTGTGNGTLGLDLIDGPAAISDAAGNTLAGGSTGAVLFSSPTSFTIDKTPIAVNAIMPVATNPTHLASVDFTVTFNKSVTGVSAADFALAANGITGAAITNVTGSGTTWTVTANTGTGNGTLGLNVVNGAATISDAAGNTLAGANTGQVLFTGTPVYTIDKTAPAVTSIARADNSPTHAATVHFTVTFSESVTGVTAADFALAAGTGITGAAITSVSGSGTTWTVTASTGSGDGTLGLNLIDGTSAINDTAGNTLSGGGTGAVLFTGTPVYTIDKTAPTVVSITPAGGNPTNGATTQFTVTFSENVSGVNTSDFALTTGGGLTGASVTGVTGSGTAWTVTVNTGSGDGSITLKLIDGDAITDVAGNTLAGGHTGATIFTGQTAATIQKTPPSVSSITLADGNPVSAPATVHFTVTFSEALTALNASDFALVATGLTGSAITGVSGSGTTWTVTATTGLGNGTLGLKLIDGDAITDAAGNKLAGGHTGNTIFSSSTSYNVQTPVVQSISVVGLAVTVTNGTAVTNAEVATFTAVGGSQSAGSFTATIDWGDGSSSTGTVAAIANGFSVTGSHNYASPGERPVKITVTSGSVTQQGLTTATVGSGTQLFIAQVYRDLLKREAEPQGLQFWTNLIDGGLSRQTAVAQIESSPEFRNAVVQGLYQLYLHRAADPTALASMSDFLLHGTPEQVAAMLTASSEYFQVRGGGTNSGYLTALFNDALNRAPDASPLQATAPLDLTQQANRTVIAQAVFSSDEYLNDLVNFPGGVKNSFQGQIPVGFFQAYLGRDADTGAMHDYFTELRSGQPETLIIAQILASDEYFARAANEPG